MAIDFSNSSLDPEELEGYLEAACLEVVQEDPLGAYAVEHIKYSVSSLVPTLKNADKWGGYAKKFLLGT